MKVNNELFLTNPINTIHAGLGMAANQNKVEEKMEKELEEKVEAGKSMEWMEKELNPHNVAYKLKDKTDDN